MVLCTAAADVSHENEAQLSLLHSSGGSRRRKTQLLLYVHAHVNSPLRECIKRRRRARSGEKLSPPSIHLDSDVRWIQEPASRGTLIAQAGANGIYSLPPRRQTETYIRFLHLSLGLAVGIPDGEQEHTPHAHSAAAASGFPSLWKYLRYAPHPPL